MSNGNVNIPITQRIINGQEVFLEGVGGTGNVTKVKKKKKKRKVIKKKKIDYLEKRRTYEYTPQSKRK